MAVIYLLYLIIQVDLLPIYGMYNLSKILFSSLWVLVIQATTITINFFKTEYAGFVCVDRLLGAKSKLKISKSSKSTKTFAGLYFLLQISKSILSISLDTYTMQALLIYASR